MTLNLCSTCFSRFCFPSPYKFSYTSRSSNRQNTSLFYFILSHEAISFRNQENLTLSGSKNFRTKASLSESENEVAESLVAELLDDDGDELISRVSAVKDADEALEVIAERTKRSGGVVSTSDCCSIISAALDRNNTDLALSIFYAMRSSFDIVGEKGISVERWKWSRPDVNTYTILVQGLAASLKVSDALRMIANVCRVGVSPGEEVPFGKIVRCPSCMIAVAVAQPQHGLQIVSCAKCRYQYELVSGNIVTIESEEIRMYSCRTQHGCSCVEERAKISSCYQTKNSCCCSLHCGTDPIRNGSNTQICN